MSKNKSQRQPTLPKVNVKLLLRETTMRSRIAFPENEQDELWWNEGLDHKKSGDFMERLFNAMELGYNGAKKQSESICTCKGSGGIRMDGTCGRCGLRLDFVE